MITDTSSLKRALEALRPIFKTRNVLPILYCVKLETVGNRLQISASNLDEYAVEMIEVDGEIGPVCVSFNHLSLALSGQETELKLIGKTLLVKCGNNETKISTLDAGEFPNLPEFDKSQAHGASCADIANAIKQVSWAASTDAGKPLINSTLIQSEPKSLKVVSTNGRELAVVELPLIGSEFEVVVPSEFTSNLSAFLAREGAVISTNENRIKATHNEGFYFCKQVEGLYPNYKGVIPKEKKKLGVVSVDEFKSVISGCCGFSSNSEAKGIFKFSKKELTIEFNGDNSSVLSRHLAGPFANFTIALSTKKMFKIFQNLKTEEATLFYVDELSPLWIQSGDLMVLTTPMRL